MQAEDSGEEERLRLDAALLVRRDRHLHDPLGMGERRLQRVGEPLLDPRLHHQPVHHDVDVVLFLLVQVDLLGQLEGGAVDDAPGRSRPF